MMKKNTIDQNVKITVKSLSTIVAALGLSLGVTIESAHAKDVGKIRTKSKIPQQSINKSKTKIKPINKDMLKTQNKVRSADKHMIKIDGIDGESSIKRR